MAPSLVRPSPLLFFSRKKQSNLDEMLRAPAVLRKIDFEENFCQRFDSRNITLDVRTWAQTHAHAFVYVMTL